MLRPRSMLVFFMVGLFLVGAFALVACGPTAEEVEEPGDETVDEPDVEQHFIIALETDIVQFDPIHIQDATTSSVAYQMMDRLMDRTPDGEPAPGLAKEWETSDDGLRWTFYLRQGVHFHDGSYFDSEVVKWHFERALGDESAFAANYGIVADIEVVDDYTVVFHLNEPMAAFPDNCILGNAGYIPSMKAFQEKDYDDFKMEPVGTGKFIWDEWVPGQRVTLVKNPDWWGDGPKLDRLTYRVIPESGTQVIELETGGVHLITRAGLEDLTRLQENPDFIVEVPAAYRSRRLHMNVSKPPFDDIRIRQALNYAVDMPMIVEAIASPLTVPGDSLLPGPGWGHPGEGVLPTYGYDVEKARELIEEAGYELVDGMYEKDGKPLSFTFLSPDYRYYMDKDICEAVARQLEDVGIAVELAVMEWAAFMDQVLNSEYEMCFLGWNQSGADPSLFTDALVMTGGRGNWGNRSDPRIDELCRQAQRTSDIEERRELYRRIQVKIHENAWFIFVGDEAQTFITPHYIEGYHPTAAVSGDYTQIVIKE